MPRRWGLATRLTLAVLVLLLPLLGYAVIAYAQELDARRADEIADAELLAENVASLVDAFTGNIEGTLLATSIALAIQERPIDQTNNGPELAALLREYQTLRSIFITDPEGRVIASGTGTGVGTDLSDRSYMVALRGGMTEVWSGGLVGIETGQITVAYGRAVLDAGGAVRAYVIAAFYPDVVIAGLGPALPRDSRTLMVDHQGFLLYDSARSEVPVEERDLSAVPEIQGALAGALGPFSRGPAELFEQTERFGAAVPIRGTGWALVYTRPLGPLEATLQQELLVRGGLMTLLIAIAGTFTLLVARRLTRPLSQMAQAAAAISRGERPTIDFEPEDVEVAHLAGAMETMTRSIAEREEALRFLADSSEVLSRSLSVSETLRSLADLAVPRLADWCIVDVAEGEQVRRVVVAHADATQRHLAKDLEERYRPDPSDPRSLVGQVIRSGEPLVFEEVGEELMRRAAKDDRLFDIYRAMGIRSAMILPLEVHGRRLGALTLIAAGSGRRYGQDQVGLAQELAHRAALATDNARLYEELQQALRTRRVPLGRGARAQDAPGLGQGHGPAADAAAPARRRRLAQARGGPGAHRRLGHAHGPLHRRAAGPHADAPAEHARPGARAGGPGRAGAAPGARARPAGGAPPHHLRQRRRRERDRGPLGPGAPRAGARQPAVERGQVHAAGRRDKGAGRERRVDRDAERGGFRGRHPGGGPALDLRALPAGQQRRGPDLRDRGWPDPGETDRRAARRHRGRAQHSRTGQHLQRPPASRKSGGNGATPSPAD